MTRNYEGQPTGPLAELAAAMAFAEAEWTDRDDFFRVRIQEELESLASRVKRSCRTGRLSLKDGHSRSELVLDAAFSGGGEGTFRGVHYVDDTQLMTSLVVQHWKDRVDALLSQGRITTVRRLVVYREEAELEAPLMRDFLELHRRSPGYSAKVVEVALMERKLSQAGLHVAHDFGVYGDSFVFASASSDPSSLAGTWFRDSDDVSMFRDAFDECWEVALGWKH